MPLLESTPGTLPVMKPIFRETKCQRLNSASLLSVARCQVEMLQADMEATRKANEDEIANLQANFQQEQDRLRTQLKAKVRAGFRQTAATDDVAAVPRDVREPRVNKAERIEVNPYGTREQDRSVSTSVKGVVK